VQAGGACGVWPYRLAQEFSEVYTFEPEPENFRCLTENLAGVENIYDFQAALSSGNRQGSMSLHESEQGNCGAWYFEPDDEGDISTHPLDALLLTQCDLIQLDVEGHEYEALLGARETLLRCRPTVVIEEKKLPQTTGDITRARQLLEALGYREVGRIHRDVIFRC